MSKINNFQDIDSTSAVDLQQGYQHLKINHIHLCSSFIPKTTPYYYGRHYIINGYNHASNKTNNIDVSLEIMTYKALDIANKLIARAAGIEGGDLMTNMRIQKMLYYEQGYHLAVFGTPLFEERIEPWMYGPVVPEVYEHFKHYGSTSISPETKEVIRLTDEEEELFNEVYDTYIEFSTYGLMIKTHQEAPWKDSFGKDSIIRQDKMKAFFLKKIDND